MEENSTPEATVIASERFSLCRRSPTTRRLVLALGVLIVVADLILVLASAPDSHTPSLGLLVFGSGAASQVVWVSPPYCQLEHCFRQFYTSAQDRYCQLAECFRDDVSQLFTYPTAWGSYCQLAVCFGVQTGIDQHSTPIPAR